MRASTTLVALVAFAAMLYAAVTFAATLYVGPHPLEGKWQLRRGTHFGELDFKYVEGQGTPWYRGTWTLDGQRGEMTVGWLEERHRVHLTLHRDVGAPIVLDGTAAFATMAGDVDTWSAAREW